MACLASNITGDATASLMQYTCSVDAHALGRCTDRAGPEPGSGGFEPPPAYTPLGTLLLLGPQTTAASLLRRGIPLSLSPTSLLIALVVWFVLSVLSSSLILPVGLLVPSIVVGGCLGRLYGAALLLASRYAYSTHLVSTPYVFDPSLFALAGATAFLAGSGQIRIFFAVLLLEATHELSLMPYVAVSALVANATSSLFCHHGLYHSLIEMSNLPCAPGPLPLREEPSRLTGARPALAHAGTCLLSGRGSRATSPTAPCSAWAT